MNWRGRGADPAVTRQRLLEAACLEVAERGVGGASLDAIATRARLTKGAIYSTFGSRAELLLAVVDGLPHPDLDVSTDSIDGLDWDELGARLGRAADEAPGQVFLLLELMSQSHRDADMHLRMFHRLASAAERVGARLASLLEIDDESAVLLATQLHAQLLGLWATRAVLGPERVPDSTFRDMARGLMTQAGRPA
ncbi:MAG: TetR/AcrR family transcriptional regulator, transcriptional repressor of aconitase [Frankiaceae bacterium]|jgi:AcrR family transcriptional regulator|nr:TetR/AcrR family transcriptional regulator, transcriptional repressor of aconitase [Frankiaceae bacterium]